MASVWVTGSAPKLRLMLDHFSVRTGPLPRAARPTTATIATTARIAKRAFRVEYSDDFRPKIRLDRLCLAP
jgi:hypothetical protein